MEDQLSWNQVPTSGESVTESDIKDAESMGKLPIGKFACTCVASVPRQRNPKDAPSYYIANLKWRVDSCVEINGEPVDGDDGESYEGRFLYSDVALPREGEKDGSRKQRILIASRTGIISNTSENIPENAWSELIVGKRAVLENIDDSYKKDGVLKTVRKIAFSGYESIDKATPVTKDSFADI